LSRAYVSLNKLQVISETMSQSVLVQTVLHIITTKKI